MKRDEMEAAAAGITLSNGRAAKMCTPRENTFGARTGRPGSPPRLETARAEFFLANLLRRARNKRTTTSWAQNAKETYSDVANSKHDEHAPHVKKKRAHAEEQQRQSARRDRDDFDDNHRFYKRFATA